MAEKQEHVTSISRPQLDLSILLPDQSNDISHVAIDIGGSLIKLVYFSKHSDTREPRSPSRGGHLHFVKFDKLNECLDFIQFKRLNVPCKLGKEIVMKATGGGAFKYAEVFKERLDVTFDKEDEMLSLVSGANFLLKTIRDEAFTHLEGNKQYVQIDQTDLFPYLLVNIGSGVSMIKVDADGQFQRVSGTSVGGGTFYGLGLLLTGCTTFDQILELSQQGDNSAIDLLVGDIYGGLDYSKIGLSASTIASSFGKVKAGTEYRREDLARSLLRMISYNIGQIAHHTAIKYNAKHILFSGFFIRGHAYVMDTIAYAVSFWSKGEAQAMFLRHEGFLGALGAFFSYHKDGLPNLGPEMFPVAAR